MSNQEPTTLDRQAHELRVLAWRRARARRLTQEDGWLSLAGRHWLHEGAQRAGSDASCEVRLPEAAPAFVGTFTHARDVITFLAAPGLDVELERNGARERLSSAQPVALTTDLHGAADRVHVGALSLEIMQRDSGFAVRVRDRKSAALARFAGLDYFPIRPELCLEATLEPAIPPRTLELAYESGKTERSVCPGTLVFTLLGRTLRLDPTIESGGKRLFIVFSDETRGETYGGGRFLYAPLPEDQRVVLDFNQAFNPPCAFTPYALCPLPPPQNRLPLRIEAGELAPRA